MSLRPCPACFGRSRYAYTFCERCNGAGIVVAPAEPSPPAVEPAAPRRTIFLCPTCRGKMRNGDFTVLQERHPDSKGTVCGHCGAQSTPRHDENAPLHPDEDEQRLVRVLARAREGLLLDERALFDDYLKGLTAGLKNAEEAIVTLSRALDVTSEEAAATKKKLDAVGRLIDVELRPGGGFSVTIAGDPLCWYFTPEEAEEEAARLRSKIEEKLA